MTSFASRWSYPNCSLGTNRLGKHNLCVGDYSEPLCSFFRSRGQTSAAKNELAPAIPTAAATAAATGIRRCLHRTTAATLNRISPSRFRPKIVRRRHGRRQIVAPKQQRWKRCRPWAGRTAAGRTFLLPELNEQGLLGRLNLQLVRNNERIY